MQHLFIIRGLPGSGKTTLAKAMMQNNSSLHHVEADMFFTSPTGEYRYNRNLLAHAHEWCISEVRRLLRMKASVIVSNTFSQRWEFQHYIDQARALNIQYHIIVAQGRYHNVHGVPTKVIEAMRKRWEQ